MTIAANETLQEPLYLYGLVHDPNGALDDTLAELRGATAGPPRRCNIAGQCVIVGTHDGSEILQTRRRMLAHTRVLEAAMATSTVLPIRFGYVTERREDLEALLENHAEAIDEQFARLHGLVEVGLRVSFSRDAALKATLDANRDLQLERKRLVGRGAEAHFDRIELGRAVASALDQRRTEAQHRLLHALMPHLTSHILKAPEDDVEVLRLEGLVPESRIEAIAEITEKEARETAFAPDAEPEISLVGPIPPFHFVDLTLAPADAA